MEESNETVATLPTLTGVLGDSSIYLERRVVFFFVPKVIFVDTFIWFLLEMYTTIIFHFEKFREKKSLEASLPIFASAYISNDESYLWARAWTEILDFY
jgi:hypothetical protein